MITNDLKTINSLYDPVYDAFVSLYIGPREAFVSAFKERHPDCEMDEDRGIKGEYIHCYDTKDEERKNYIWLERFSGKVDDLATLMHEVNHAAFGILEYKGVKVCDESEEAFTYYAEFWFKKCLFAIRKHDGTKPAKHKRSHGKRSKGR